ncbi:uncharacterized protein LOC144907083 [Branchiostoma floridae x Branchiostoma belcheri]
MEDERDNIEGGDGRRNGNIDCANKDLVISDQNSEIPSLLDDNKENSDQTATIQAALTMPSTTETTPDSQVVNNLSFSSLSETKTTKRQGDAILEVAKQTTAYNVQVTSNNPTTIDVASSALQQGQGHSSIIIEQPEQVIIHENVKVKDSFAVQLGQNNVIGSAQTPESEGSALVGATSAAVRQPQVVIRQPAKVLLYSRKDIEGCKNVQIGDNNIMGKLMPQEDEFVKTCINLGINPKQKEDIFERLGHEETREQFSAMMAEKCNVQCKLRNAGEGCILLELEVPTEADRLQLLRMARDGTFPQSRECIRTGHQLRHNYHVIFMNYVTTTKNVHGLQTILNLTNPLRIVFTLTGVFIFGRGSTDEIGCWLANYPVGMTYEYRASSRALGT